ncbi:hypothetical protein [Pseudomonas arsenicoxydans]|uniref:Uncharacterized protein n=1 Tax=Pseudomonas arsenicoxydans TaxID=702115 RepID=A0A4P6G2W3_9PSED|nr:hypothetical protein [Pseudomonas arsenicoxydans]QAY85793.1 hypothetical protein CUN61_18170 [Pseudomonas arsenicoxydans]
MIPRFAVVPAIPMETGSTRNGSRFYCKTASIGFNLYDNEEKRRLPTHYASREEADKECLQLNDECLQRTLVERPEVTSTKYRA